MKDYEETQGKEDVTTSRAQGEGGVWYQSLDLHTPGTSRIRNSLAAQAETKHGVMERHVHSTTTRECLCATLHPWATLMALQVGKVPVAFTGLQHCLSILPAKLKLEEM